MTPGPQQEYVGNASQSALVSHAFASSGICPASVRHGIVGLCPADPAAPPLAEPPEPPEFEPPELEAPPASDRVPASLDPPPQAQAKSSGNQIFEAKVGLMLAVPSNGRARREAARAKGIPCGVPGESALLRV